MDRKRYNREIFGLIGRRICMEETSNNESILGNIVKQSDGVSYRNISSSPITQPLYQNA